MKIMDDIRLQKNKLEQEQMVLDDLKRDTLKVEESYQEYFFLQERLFNDLQHGFHQSKTALLCEDTLEKLNWYRRGIFDFLDEQQQEIKKQFRVIGEQQKELDWQEKQVLDDYKEEKNEH